MTFNFLMLYINRYRHIRVLSVHYCVTVYGYVWLSNMRSGIKSNFKKNHERWLFSLLSSSQSTISTHNRRFVNPSTWSLMRIIEIFVTDIDRHVPQTSFLTFSGSSVTTTCSMLTFHWMISYQNIERSFCRWSTRQKDNESSPPLPCSPFERKMRRVTICDHVLSFSLLLCGLFP